MSILDLTLLDWLALAIVAYSAVVSTMRGLVREVLGLVTVLAALFLAAWFHDDVARLIEGVVRTRELALFVGFAFLFLAALAAGFAGIWLIYRAMQVVHVEWFDRLLGGAFGLARGWLIAAVIFMGLTSFGIGSGAVRDSRLSPYFLAGSRAVALLTPFDLKARFLIGYEEIQRWWNENLVEEPPADAPPEGNEGEVPDPVPENAL